MALWMVSYRQTARGYIRWEMGEEGSDVHLEVLGVGWGINSGRGWYPHIQLYHTGYIESPVEVAWRLNLTRLKKGEGEESLCDRNQ